MGPLVPNLFLSVSYRYLGPSSLSLSLSLFLTLSLSLSLSHSLSLSPFVHASLNERHRFDTRCIRYDNTFTRVIAKNGSHGYTSWKVVLDPFTRWISAVKSRQITRPGFTRIYSRHIRSRWIRNPRGLQPPQGSRKVFSQLFLVVSELFWWEVSSWIRYDYIAVFCIFVLVIVMRYF